MSAKMLLRSRSTPLLSSLCGVLPVSQAGGLPEKDRDKVSVEPQHDTARRLSRSVSFASAALVSASESLAPLFHQHQQQPVGISEAAMCFGSSERALYKHDPWSKFKRVQSEGDLESLSMKPSIFDIASLSLTSKSDSVSVSGLQKNDGDDHRYIQRQPSRRLSLPRLSSLSIIPSSSDTSGSESDDAEDTNGATDVDESDSSKMDGLNVNFGKNFEGISFEARPHDRVSEEDATRGSSQPHYYAGDNHTSYTISSDGNSLLCNTRGCKPACHDERAGAVLIAGESGSGGGNGGGRNVGVATHGEGGRGDFLGQDVYYRQALEADPGHPLLLRNYARFLHEVMLDAKKAECYYERALLANPGDGELLGLYAKLIWDVHKDEERAASYFEQAVLASPDDCYVAGAYASFLWASEDAEDQSDLSSSKGLDVITSPVFSSIAAH